jgi:predicted nucleic acid-binding protein
VGLLKAIGKGPVGLDTAIFIYFIENHSRYGPLAGDLFRAIDRGRISAITSELTLLETLIVPYRARDFDLAERYETILTGSRNLEMIPIGRPLLRSAAALRAATSVRTPDAVQLSAAISRGCPVFLTNDRRLPDLAQMRILQLSDYAS